MLSYFIGLLKDLLFFTGSYSNNVFLDPLSDEQSDIYVEKMLNGDQDARNKLIEHNLRLVAHIVKKFDDKEFADDLISIGTIGLIKGIDTYKNDKKTKITTYAARCIQNEILMYYRSNKKNNNDISLEGKIIYDKEGNEINLIDLIKDKSPDIIDHLSTKENVNKLKEYFKVLNKREKDIIIKRYGLNNHKEMTQKQIAQEMNISRSYVSRIEKRALTKLLKEFIKNKTIN